tara:strand:+ start:85 stop:1188 length:1104 start_codon:yes stop_codon:yes gene_type:complete
MPQRILIIDDEQSVRKLIAEILQFAGFETIDAGCGEDGVALAAEFFPHMIICDVSMPGIDGFETLARVRQIDELSATPFIFLTGRTDRKDIRHGMSSGADDYLTKPFNAVELIEAVKARMNRQTEVMKVSEKKLDEFRGNIVHMLPHELRTPLQGIMGFADILADEYETMDRDEIGELAKRIMKSSKRLHRVVENFLVYAQIQVYAKDKEKMTALRNQTTVISQAAIDEAINQIPQIDTRRVDLAVWITEANIYHSRDDLKKTIEELVNNAIKFSDPGTPVQVDGWEEDGTYFLTVRDQGRGMTEEQIDNIGACHQFDRQFYEQQGTGLGLSISEELTRLHGGELQIDSEPEVYTQITLRLKPAKAE